jgi:hypothetical protein
VEGREGKEEGVEGRRKRGKGGGRARGGGKDGKEEGRGRGGGCGRKEGRNCCALYMQIQNHGFFRSAESGISRGWK